MKLLKLRLTCSDAGWLLAWAGACGLAILFAWAGLAPCCA
jgi:hypothetical protein